MRFHRLVRKIWIRSDEYLVTVWRTTSRCYKPTPSSCNRLLRVLCQMCVEHSSFDGIQVITATRWRRGEYEQWYLKQLEAAGTATASKMLAGASMAGRKAGS